MISTTKVNVRYAETDQMGIVHHSVYPIWYELARTNLSKELGFSYKDMEKIGLMTPLVGLNCKYIHPACYDDTLDVTARISKLTPARIEFYYEVLKNGELINIGTTTHAFVGGKDLNIVNAKKSFPEIYFLMEKNIESIK